MSFVNDQLSTIDSHLDRLELSGLHAPAAPNSASAAQEDVHDPGTFTRLNNLRNLIKPLSTAPLAKLSTANSLVGVLQQARLSSDCSTCLQSENASDQPGGQISTEPSYEHELEWALIGKVTLHTHGLVLDTLLRQTVPINDELWYWNSVLNSHRYTGLYSIQTSPARAFAWLKLAYQEARDTAQPISDQWKHFYGLVHTMVLDSSIKNMQRRVASPLMLIRDEIRQKVASLDRVKLLHANAIGQLLSKSFNRQSLQYGMANHDSSASEDESHEWERIILNSITVMNALLNAALAQDIALYEADEAMDKYIENDLLASQERDTKALAVSLRPVEASEGLLEILQQLLPDFTRRSAQQLDKNGRPSRLTRYWLPAVALVISSSTILRICVNRQAAIEQWIRELGSTTIAFWSNWVVEPTKKLLGTIRHDQTSEISIMSKRSLQGDRESLERMVVDFALANPSGPSLNEEQIADIRLKVGEGDLTPVLKAYEKDLQSPVYGAVRGNLIRALLIQIQKTKVDVEVALGGIDTLLKSQELVFGFVGLTPGVLVTFGAVRYFSSLFDRRKGSKKGQRLSQATLILRNIDRILTASPQPNESTLSYTEHGLIVIEALSLRNMASKTFPRQKYRELITDIDDLIDIDSGVGRQIRVADRIRWAYSNWL